MPPEAVLRADAGALFPQSRVRLAAELRHIPERLRRIAFKQRSVAQT
jgi:hypothetical protein